MVNMLGIAFWGNDKRMIPQDHPGLALAIYAAFLFAEQKN